jgi:opacity protein-like surface antigen
MVHEILTRRCWFSVVVSALLGVIAPQDAHAQGFISPSLGYNFGGNAGCRTATDCKDKNWNLGGSVGTLGSIVGFEAELTYEGEFTGDRPDQTSSMTTLMGNFMLAPRITIVQPYGLVGIGVIRTEVENTIAGSSDSQNQVGWSIGGGLMVFVQRHVGLKGDVRYYHSFQTLDLLGFELARDEKKIDFGRAAFGVVLKF